MRSFPCEGCDEPIIEATHVHQHEMVMDFNAEPDDEGIYLLNHTMRGVLFARPGGSPGGVRQRYGGRLHRAHVCDHPPNE